MTQPTEKQLYRPQEAAKLIGVCKRTIDNYAVKGLLTRKKIGFHVTVYDRDELLGLAK